MKLIKGIFTFLLINIVGLISAQEIAKGIVYHDLNKNGRKERHEKGIPNVAVSNGYDVTLTNNKGEYTLNIGNDNIIFVIKPSGYGVALDENNIPKFYYIHKPLGSPKGLKYAGSLPTEKLPNSVDFGLYKQVENNTFKAFVFGDPQTYNKKELRYFQKGIIGDIKSTSGISFGISLGDLVGDDLSLHQPYKEVVSAIGLPWYNVIGNHDLNYDVQADSLSDETFEKNFGPANYSFNYADAHFIILDDILYPHPIKKKGYWGGFREDQLQFIENDLKHVPKNKLIVVAYHIPIISEKESDVSFRREDKERFLSLLAPYPNTIGLSAHNHFQTQYYLGKEYGFDRDTPYHEYNVGTTSGDWYSGVFDKDGIPVSTMRDGTPRGYSILTVDGNKYSFDYKVAGRDPSYQIELTGAERVTEDFADDHELFANFFMGDAQSKVEFRVDSGRWERMYYKVTPDPGYLYEALKYDHTKDKIMDNRRPSNPVCSTHLWSIKYPVSTPGTYLYQVRATDRYGKTHYASKTVVVEPRRNYN